MIYNGTDSLIEIDILSDINAWAYEMLIKAGFENVTVDPALYQYCDMQLRLLPAKPRKVLVSKELVIPEKAKVGYEFLKAAVESGKPLLPFMSKSIVNIPGR